MITLYHISIILDTYQYFTDIGTSLARWITQLRADVGMNTDMFE